MKLPLQKLSYQLTQQLAPLYVVSGDEILLVQEALDLIREAAYKKGFSERIRIPADENNWVHHFYSHTQSLSLFSTQRIVELDLSLTKLTAASSKFLQNYAATPSLDICLIIRTKKTDSKSEQSSWYKALDKAGIIIPIWPMTLEQLPSWILQRAKKLQITLTSAAADLLATRMEGNLLAASQTLEKLSLLQLPDTIDHRIIEQITTDDAQFDIFALTDSMIARNPARSIRILDRLEAEDVEPTLVLWAITRELRTMSSLAKQLKNGSALGTLFPQFRIFEKRQPAVRAFLQHYQIEQCYEFLIQTACIDRLIKGADKGNVWDAFKNLMAKI